MPVITDGWELLPARRDVKVPSSVSEMWSGEPVVTNAAMPDLVVGLIRVRDPTRRFTDQATGIAPYVAELTAIVHNRGDALADESTTQFWVHGTEIDRELRVVYTPAVLPGDEIEVTALWDVRDRHGEYEITVTADAFGQIAEGRKDNNSASIHVVVRAMRIEVR